VFRRVRQIEAKLGVRLFDRSRAGYTATAAGEEIAALAARVEVDVTAPAPIPRLRSTMLRRMTGSCRTTAFHICRW
jgi:DNA-binding transcriptional LysR family regulator